MAESILFRGSVLKHFDLRQGKEGGDVFCRIHMSADYSEQVRDKMDWEEIPESITDCKLSGALLATNFILTPGDKQLRQHELNFNITSVEDFCVVALKDDDGDVCGRELRFVVRTPQDGVEAFLGQYIRRVGRHAGALKIGYTVQGKLDLDATDDATDDAKAETKPAAEETEDADSGCVSCNNGIPFEDGEKTTHASGMKCTREAGPTLASALGGERRHAREEATAAPRARRSDDRGRRGSGRGRSGAGIELTGLAAAAVP